jgi:hypothetical protein
MLTILFWNMGGVLPAGTDPQVADQQKDRLLSAVGNLVRRHEVDLLLVAECPVGQEEMLGSINKENTTPFQKPDPRSMCDRVKIYSRFPARFLSLFAGSESARYTCRHLRLPDKPEILLFVVHLGSKLYKSDESQTLAAPRFHQVIRLAERRARHERTILVGDFNLNPFDPAMVGAEGLNAVMTRELALRKTRTVDALQYPFFYNPMWGLFGDATHEIYPPGHADHEPPGTCYFPARESRWYYWNMLDQVLLRPTLLPMFRNRDLRVLTTDGYTSFLHQTGLPDRENFSDHLPLLFHLHLAEE